MTSNILDEIYDILIRISNCPKTNDNVNRATKLDFIKNNMDNLDDTELKTVEKLIIDSFKKIETDDSIRKRIALEIINRILIALNKEPIHDLTDFKNVSREELLSLHGSDVITRNREYILLNKFNKQGCNIYQEKKIANPHFSLLKGMLRQANYSLCSTIKIKTEKKVRTKYTFYYIRANENDQHN